MGDAERFENDLSKHLDGAVYTKTALVGLREMLDATRANSWLHECLAVSALDKALPPPVLSCEEPGCGELAFKALFPRIGASARSHFEKAFENGWMNRRSMESALRAVGGSYQVLQQRLPNTGLALIEWTGTWRAKGFWGSDLKNTHWVAVVEGFVYDANWSGWLPQRIWEEVVVNEILISLPGATGWRPHTGYELS